jgi:N6-L-threonylcarbamoyladenine synthase
MLLLGIETSCDETSAAVVEDGRLVHANVTQSSAKDFAVSGGIIPEQAARRQLECILPVIDACFSKAGKGWSDINAVAVTKGPGLIGSLIVGTATARVLARVFNKPLIGVHHTLGHLCSTFLVEKSQIPNNKSQINLKSRTSDSKDSSASSASSPEFPILTLSASGGHTELWYRTDHLKGVRLGQTLDDAAGEAFDKGAVLLGLGFPGGPALSKLAKKGNSNAFDFPIPLRKEPGMDFSFSGLKTALKYTLRDISRKPGLGPGIRVLRYSSTRILEYLDSLDSFTLADLAASYQEAICSHLLDRLKKALKRHPETKEIHLVGGVAANRRLRTLMQEHIRQRPTVNGQLSIRWPAAIEFCTDNAAMIAAAGCVLLKHGKKADADFRTAASMELTGINHATL